MAEEVERKSIESSVLGKLPRFDGKSNVKQFIKSITKRAALEKWNGDEQASVIRYLCTGFAETFIDSQPDLDLCDFKEICQLLLNRFTPKVSTSEAYAQLLSIKQHRRSVNSFAEEIETKAADVADCIEDLKKTSSRNELLVSVFISGVDPHLKRLLTATEFDDFADLVQAAKRCEDTFQDNRRNVNTVETAEETPYHQPRTHFRPRMPLRSRMPFQSRMPFKPRAPFQPSVQRYQRMPRKLIDCWFCGEEGHIQHECPRKYYQYNFKGAPSQANQNYSQAAGEYVRTSTKN